MIDVVRFVFEKMTENSLEDFVEVNQDRKTLSCICVQHEDVCCGLSLPARDGDSGMLPGALAFRWVPRAAWVA